MTHFRVEPEVCTIWSNSDLKIVQNKGDCIWEPFGSKIIALCNYELSVLATIP